MFKVIVDICSFYWSRYKKRFLYSLLIYFLMVGVGAIVGISTSDSTTWIGQAKLIHAELSSSSLLSPVLKAYLGRETARAIGLTIGINLVFGSFVTITAANMFGLGALMFIIRPFLWGMLLISPISRCATGPLMFVGPVVILLLEGTAYVIAFAASLDLMLAMVEPGLMNETRRIDALKKAWIYNLRSYVLVSIMLLVAAVAEVALAFSLLPT